MSVKVKCTKCGLELQAPDDLVGKHATCPQCRTKLTVGGGSLTQSTSVSMKALPVPPPAPPASPGRGSVQPSPDEIASYLEDPAAPPSASERDSVGALTKSTTASVAAPRPPTASTQSARFIIADATARRIELGAGGQLPRLVLDEAQKKEVPEEQTSGSKTWILLAAVGGSVLLSLVMLLFDFAAPQAERGDKEKARWTVEHKYVQGLADDDPLPACQPILARAVQAYNRGDYSEEKRLYHHVLDMLHSEALDHKGITGVKRTSDDRVANDLELESLISTLLRE